MSKYWFWIFFDHGGNANFIFFVNKSFAQLVNELDIITKWCGMILEGLKYELGKLLYNLDMMSNFFLIYENT